MRNKIFLAAVVVLILLLGGSYLEGTRHKSADKGLEGAVNTKLDGWMDAPTERFNTCSILYVTFGREGSLL